MSAIALLFTLDAIGVSITTYLIGKRRAAEAPVCPIGNDCTKVLTSKYNHLFGIHNDVAGLGFYLVAGTITALLVLETGPTALLVDLLTLLLVGASMMSLIFTYIQWRVLKAWCFWCVTSAVTVWLMTAIDLIYVSRNHLAL